MSAQPETPWSLAHRRPLTVADLPEDEVGRTELIDGGVYVTPAADVEHQILVARWTQRLGSVAPSQLVASPGGNVIANDQTLLIPDVWVIDPSAIVQGGLGVDPGGLVLAVEITSPSTRVRDLTIKRVLYERWGVPYVLVDRDTAPPTVTVYGELPGWARLD
jgi:Uma2 family endonuclease